MEDVKNILASNYSNIYLNRLSHYSAYGGIIGGIISMLFLMKFKRGFVFGAGIGAGYCHSDLVKVYKNYLHTENKQ